MGPLGLDPIRCWAESKNRDPTIAAICGNQVRILSAGNEEEEEAGAPELVSTC